MKSKLIPIILLLLFATNGYSQHFTELDAGHTFFHRARPKIVDPNVTPCDEPVDGKIALEVELLLSEKFKGPESDQLYFSAFKDGVKVGSTVKKVGLVFAWEDSAPPEFIAECPDEKYYIASGKIYIDVDECKNDEEVSLQSFEFCYEIYEGGTFIKITEANFADYFDLSCYNDAHAKAHSNDPATGANGHLNEVPACSNFALEICCEDSPNDGSTGNEGINNEDTNNGEDTNGKDLSGRTDSDNDGIPDLVDNCPDLPNPDQLDEDQNGIGDLCEDYGQLDSNGQSESRNSNDSKSLFHSHTSITYHIYSINGQYLGHYHNLDRYKNISGSLNLYIVVTTENNKYTKTEKLILSFE
jgi:hypothetical protein